MPTMSASFVFIKRGPRETIKINYTKQVGDLAPSLLAFHSGY
jgi:hypothetical protein